MLDYSLKKYNGITVAPIYMFNKLTKYVVAKDGTIYNTKTGHKLTWKTDTKGYYCVTLSENGIHQDKRVHVLVALGFVKNPDPEKYNIVNHLDGNKKNPNYWNLEWTDYSGNMQHAWKNGLLKPASGENSGKAKLTNDIVRSICEDMEGGKLTQLEISAKYNVDITIIHTIKGRYNWKDISKDYKVENCKLDTKKNISDDIAEKICVEFEKNQLTITGISKKYNVPYDTVLGIYRGSSYRYISDNYDLTLYTRHERAYSDELHKKIDMMIKEGKTNKEIIKECNLVASPKIASLLYRKRRDILILSM